MRILAFLNFWLFALEMVNDFLRIVCIKKDERHFTKLNPSKFTVFLMNGLAFDI